MIYYDYHGLMIIMIIMIYIMIIMNNPGFQSSSSQLLLSPSIFSEGPFFVRQREPRGTSELGPKEPVLVERMPNGI